MSPYLEWELVSRIFYWSGFPYMLADDIEEIPMLITTDRDILSDDRNYASQIKINYTAAGQIDQMGLILFPFLKPGGECPGGMFSRDIPLRWLDNSHYLLANVNPEILHGGRLSSIDILYIGNAAYLARFHIFHCLPNLV